MPVRLGIQADGLKQVAKDLRSIDKTFGKQLQKGLKKAADIVAADARSRASWSTRIPSSIRTRATARGGASVLAGGPKAPHASFYEATSGSGHRHPIFGRGDRSTWRWTDQPGPRPFMVPALQANADRVAETVADVLEELFKSAGWR